MSHQRKNSQRLKRLRKAGLRINGLSQMPAEGVYQSGRIATAAMKAQHTYDGKSAIYTFNLSSLWKFCESLCLDSQSAISPAAVPLPKKRNRVRPIRIRRAG